MKKRTVAIVAAVALVALAIPALAFASILPVGWPSAGEGTARPVLSEPVSNEAPARATAPCPAANESGVYGNWENGSCPAPGNTCPAPDGACPGYADADGDGVCDNCAGDRSACPGYADADGDGVCDNRGSGACAQSQGCPQGKGHGQGHGWGHGRGCMRG